MVGTYISLVPEKRYANDDHIIAAKILDMQKESFHASGILDVYYMIFEVIDDFRFFSSFLKVFQSYQSGRWVGDNERLFGMKPRLRLKRFPPPAGLESGTDRSASQRLTY